MQAAFCKILAVPLLVLAGFCSVGFVGTFEPLPPVEQWTWRTVYVVMGFSCLYASARLWRNTCKSESIRKALSAGR